MYWREAQKNLFLQSANIFPFTVTSDTGGMGLHRTVLVKKIKEGLQFRQWQWVRVSGPPRAQKRFIGMVLAVLRSPRGSDQIIFLA